MTGRRCRRVAVAAALVLAAAGCGVSPAVTGSHKAPATAIVKVDEPGVVPWVNRPGTMFMSSLIPTPPPKTDAPSCTAADVRVHPDGGNGGGGHQYATFAFRNISSSTCILKGFPRVVATAPGKRAVIAADGGFFVGHDEVTADMPPGRVTYLSIETETDCKARYVTPNTWPTLIYHEVTVDIPGGGEVQLHFGGTTLDVLCGLFTGRFSGPHPAPRYTYSPVARATAKLELPAVVPAGGTLSYVVDLTNPTGRAMPLNPCPGYQQGLGFAGKVVLALNCDRVHRLLPHQTVRYAMELMVPADTPTGPAAVHWDIAGAVDVMVNDIVEVHGSDVPCTAGQLIGTIAGPGAVPGPPNLWGMKGIATEVPLVVTNKSASVCSVLGTPQVAIASADGRNLGLSQLDAVVIEHNADPTATPVTLAPHGSARTTLFWDLPWCAADPNPVTVTITLPANGASLTITPSGGWQPPPCRGDHPAHPRYPGAVSSVAFRPT